MNILSNRFINGRNIIVKRVEKQVVGDPITKEVQDKAMNLVKKHPNKNATYERKVVDLGTGGLGFGITISRGS